MTDKKTSLDHSSDASLDKINFGILLDAIADAMLLVDVSGQVVMANSAAQNLFKYSQQELCGLEVEALMPHRFREHHRQYRKRYLDNPAKRSMGNGRELVLLNRNGEEVRVDIGLSPVAVEKEVFILITLNPVDQKSHAERTLQQREELFLLAKQSAGVGVFEIDCDNEKVYCDDPLCGLWNNEFEQSMTYSQFLSLIHAQDRMRYQTAFDQAVGQAGDGRLYAEFRITQSNEPAEAWIVMLGRTQFERGVARRIVGITRDITERKNLEQRLQQQRNENEALVNRQIAVQTAAAIAHEINSPLTAISAFSEVASQALRNSPVDYDQIEESLQGCVQQAQLAGHRLYDLMVLLQEGETVVEALNLNEILQDALTQARHDGYGEFKTELKIQPDLPAVTANRVQIQRVILVLIHNAVEAMRSVNILDAEISFTIQTVNKENMAMVTVQDNGPGIDKETRRQIFQPFFSTKQEGIGMGLAISRSLIEANGGQLWIDPDFSQGARFNFTLPFAQ